LCSGQPGQTFRWRHCQRRAGTPAKLTPNAEAHRLFLYKRDEGGFGGWVAKRVRMSRKTADRFIDVFNAAGRVANLATLDVPISGLYC
jgi:hypothetical protein